MTKELETKIRSALAEGYSPQDIQAHLEKFGKPGQKEVALPIFEEVLRRGISGATLGLSEFMLKQLGGVTLDERESSLPGWGRFAADMSGMFIPIGQVAKGINITGKMLAKAFPVAAKMKYAAPLGKMLGWGVAGSAMGGIEDFFKSGEMPSTSDVIKHGASWSAMEGLLSGAGYLGRFGNGINKIAKLTGKKRMDVMKDIMAQAKEMGVSGAALAKEAGGTAAASFNMYAQEVALARNISKKDAIKELVREAADAGIPAGEYAAAAGITEGGVESTLARIEETAKEKMKPEVTKPEPIEKAEVIKKDVVKDLTVAETKQLAVETEKQARARALKETSLKSADEAQEAIDLLEDKLAEQGFDLSKIWNLPEEMPEGFVKSPEELKNLYRVRDAFYERDLDKSVSEISSILKRHNLNPEEIDHILERIHLGKDLIERSPGSAAYFAEHDTLDIIKNTEDFAFGLAMDFMAPEDRMAIDSYNDVVRYAPKALQKAANIVGELQEYFGLRKPRAEKVIVSKLKTLPAPKEKPKPKPKEKPKPKPKEKPTPTLTKVERLGDTFLPPEQEIKLSNLQGRMRELGKSSKDIQAMSREWMRKYHGQKGYAKWQSKEKWHKAFKDLTSQERSDMIYYREHPRMIGKSIKTPGTGNPTFSKEDTYEALTKRLSKKARDMKPELDAHFEAGLKALKDSPFVKDVSPRDFIREHFIPHFYKGDADEAMKRLGKRFTTKNPFASKREFITFNDALVEAGLKPKYNDISEFMQHYDYLINRVISNNELVKTIKATEKDLGISLIANKAKNPKFYDEALSKGWVKYEDPFLRSYTRKFDGKIERFVSDADALVHPDMAKNLKNVFNKEAYKPENKFWSTYDRISNFIKELRVSLSAFHFGALAESAIGASTWKRFLNPKAWWQDAGKFLHDPEIMEPALKAGLKIDANPEVVERGIEGALRSLTTNLKTGSPIKQGVGVAVENVLLKPYSKLQKALWNEYHPRLKINAFYDYSGRAFEMAAKEGKKLTPTLKRQIEREVASLVNNQFGGQMWEFDKYLDDPATKKWLYRFMGYPDWSISAIKQAGGAIKDIPQIVLGDGQTLTGSLARKYWLKYLSGLLLMQNFANFLTTGHSTFENEDPKHKMDVALPDKEVTIAGVKFNPGRDEKGRRIYTHLGKQMWEIPRYGTDFLSQMFSKSNPIVQIIGTQALSGRPYKGEIFPAQGKFVEGGFKPWEGTKGFGQVKYRGKEVLRGIVPFSATGLMERGMAPSLATGMALPISKGLGLKASEEFLDKAIRNDDVKSIKVIMDVLRDNGYQDKSIKATITKVMNRIKREDKSKK